MRGFFYTLSALLVIGLAYWAYKENYATQEAVARVEKLQREIGESHEKLAVLKAEWAYLNRPERLRELAELNFGALGLIPIGNNHFGSVDQVSFPAVKIDEVTDPVDLSADFEPLGKGSSE